MEGIYHLPISAWMLNAILEGRSFSVLLLSTADPCRPSVALTQSARLRRPDRTYYFHVLGGDAELAGLFNW